jgi:putative flippase GtrA
LQQIDIQNRLTTARWIGGFSITTPNTTGGLGSMISFFISTTLAQIVAFITNRKKTFYANNNIVFSAIVYTLMMATFICLQTWSGPILQQKFDAVIHDQNVSLLLAKLLWMFMSFLIYFPMNKYIIMRKKPERTAKNGGMRLRNNPPCQNYKGLR